MLSQASHVFKCKPITGVIHIGADELQLEPEYHSLTPNVVWIDAIPPTQDSQVDNFISACIASRADIRTLIITNYKQCCGLYEPSDIHKQVLTGLEVVDRVQINTINLDKLFNEEGLKSYNMLTISVNGAELEVLQGGEQSIKAFDYVLVTQYNVNMFDHSCSPQQIKEWMTSHNYELACVLKPQVQDGSEKALYVTKELKTIYMTNKVLSISLSTNESTSATE